MSGQTIKYFLIPLLQTTEPLAQLKKLASQTAIYGLSSMLGRLLNYLLVPLYTRLFTPAEYGVVTEFYSYATFLMIVFTYGMETAFFKFYNQTDQPGQVISSAILALIPTTILTGALLWLFTPAMVDYLGYENHPEYFIWFILILMFDALTAIPFARLRALEKPIAFTAYKWVNILVNIGLNLFFLVYCPSQISENPKPESWVKMVYEPEIGVGYIFISNLIASLTSFLLFIPVYFKISFKWNWEILGKMFVYALPLLAGGLAGMVNETMDRIMLRWMIPDQAESLYQTGIYGANYKLAMIMTLFIQMFRFAAEPFFFKISKDPESKVLYGKIIRIFHLICLVIFLVVSLFLDIFKLFIGENFYEGLHVVPVLLMANLLLGLFMNLSYWYKNSGKTIYGLIFAAGGAALTIVLNYFLIPTFGYTGCAWTTLICYATMAAASYFMMKKESPISIHGLELLIPIGIASAVVVAFRTFGEVGNDIHPMISSLLILLFMLYLGWKEKETIRTFLKGTIKK